MERNRLDSGLYSLVRCRTCFLDARWKCRFRSGFFTCFGRGERVLGSAMGLQVLPEFPYDGPQGVGAYLAIACFGLYGGRRHFYGMFRSLMGKRDGNLPPEMQDSTDYRWPPGRTDRRSAFSFHFFTPAVAWRSG